MKNLLGQQYFEILSTIFLTEENKCVLRSYQFIFDPFLQFIYMLFLSLIEIC